jgi:hypothetical protein
MVVYFSLRWFHLGTQLDLIQVLVGKRAETKVQELCLQLFEICTIQRGAQPSFFHLIL